MSEEEPKIIIDEDWKSQVEREKAEADAKAADSPTEPKGTVEEILSGVVADEEAKQPEGETDDGFPPPPPPSLMLLVSTLATQAMAAMGQVPGDDGKPLPVNLPYAKHFIDMIGVLEEKTQGNVTDEEKQQISDALHQMRMFFVTVSQQEK